MDSLASKTYFSMVYDGSFRVNFTMAQHCKLPEILTQARAIELQKKTPKNFFAIEQGDDQTEDTATSAQTPSAQSLPALGVQSLPALNEFAEMKKEVSALCKMISIGRGNRGGQNHS